MRARAGRKKIAGIEKSVKSRLCGAYVVPAATIAAQANMKTQIKAKSGGLSESAKSITYNQNQARVMAQTNELLGLVSPGEAGRAPTLSSGGAGWSPSPSPAVVYRSGGWGAAPPAYPSITDRRAAAAAAAGSVESLGGEFVYRGFGAFCSALVPPWEPCRVDAWAAGVASGRAAVAAHDAERAARAGLLSAADIVAAAHEAALASADCEADRAARRGLLSAVEADNLHAIARWRRLGTCVGYGEAVAMAPLGADRADIRRPWLERLKAASLRSIGRGWHTDQAARAAVEYTAARAAEVRVVAAGLLRRGLVGRAAARAARIGKAQAARWLHQNSRREALSLREVGAAAGVDDLGAGADWSAELQSISGAVHQRAAVCRATLTDLAKALLELNRIHSA